MYNLEQEIANKSGWYTPQEATSYYGHARTLEEVVLHHWDAPAHRPNFAGNLNYLLNPQTHGGVPTANTVIGWDEANNKIRIVDTVPYPSVAFTSSGQSGTLKNDRAKYINCVSVGIEIDPLIEVNGSHRQDIIDAVGYRVWKYRQQAGRDIPLRGHNTYVATDCPGNMPFNEIEQSAQRWAKGENDMIETSDQAAEIVRAVFDREPTQHEVNDLVGRNWYDAIRLYRTSGPGQTIHAQVVDFPKLQAQVTNLQQAIASSADRKKLDTLIAEIQTDLKKYGGTQ